MIVAWLTYGLLVGGLVSLGAVAAERAARALGWSTRWVWVGALALTAGLPLLAWLNPATSAPGPLPALPGAFVMESLPVVVGAVDEGGPTALELALLGWALATAGLLLWVATLAARLRVAGRRWPRREVDGVEVLVSRRTGPAAMGLLRGRVVVPEWALALDASRRRLLVLHEAEHVRARDPQLAAAGLLVCALVPWLLPLWWQLARLRLAIEVDCDARVLRRDGDVYGYGTLLLEVGQRRASLAVALMESRSMLERRIRMIAGLGTRRRTFRALGLGGAAAVLLAVACETPGPTEAGVPEPSEPTLSSVQEGTQECAPVVYVNGEAASASALSALEPDGIASIEVIKGRLAAEAGLMGVDGDSIRAEDVSFRALGEGVADGDAGCGLILVLTKDASPEAQARARALSERLARERTRPREAPSFETVAERPTFTPFNERPQLANAAEVREALARNYPPLLRNAGIGGTVNVWFLLDKTGTVRKVQVNKGSGHEAMDQAALEVAALMRFTPARLDGEPVPAWVALDITFETTAGEAADGDPPAGAGSGSAADSDGRPEAELAAPSSSAGGAGPTFTPMTERPRLTNQAEVSRALIEHYPPLLRNAGVGGTVNVWFHIDETGRVVRTQVNRSSGHEALDQAALRIADVMAFTPARNGDAAVPVWVALDITFAVE